MANKPAYLVILKKFDKDKDKDDDQDDREKHQNKKLKKEKRIQDPTYLIAMISNTCKVAEWDCKANYHVIFTKQVNCKTPPFNSDGISACNKWHCQGYCFADCARSATYKPFSDENLKKNCRDWVKDLKNKFA
jgi:hypothetical protein